VPATAVVTEPFQGLAAAFADTLGAPGYPVVLVPHPVAPRSRAALEAIARDAADAVAARLVGG
jgi:transposase